LGGDLLLHDYFLDTRYQAVTPTVGFKPVKVSQARRSRYFIRN
jgi:hypothetical protein